MKIIVINLERSRERRELMRVNLERLGLDFEFFTGIDALRGEHLAVSRYSEKAALWQFESRLTPLEIGCFASHYLIWQKCAAGKWPAVILEDDVVLSPGFVEALKTTREIIREFPMIRLCSSAWEPYRTVSVRSLPGGFEVVLYPRGGTSGTQCYALSPRAAEDLIKYAKVWSFPLDLYLDRYWMHGLPNYALLPFYVDRADPAVYPSLIGTNRRDPAPQQSLALRVQRNRNRIRRVVGKWRFRLRRKWA